MHLLERYTDYIQYHRSLRTFRTYRPILNLFGEFCTHTYVDEIDRATIMEFATHCLKLGQNGKTIYNNLVVICQLLKQYGRTKILNANDVHRDTIMRLGVKVGQGCTALMHETMRDLPCTRLELDEIWGSVGKKDRNVQLDESAPVGSVWTFCGLTLIRSWYRRSRWESAIMRRPPPLCTMWQAGCGIGCKSPRMA